MPWNEKFYEETLQIQFSSKHQVDIIGLLCKHRQKSVKY